MIYRDNEDKMVFNNIKNIEVLDKHRNYFLLKDRLSNYLRIDLKDDEEVFLVIRKEASKRYRVIRFSIEWNSIGLFWRGIKRKSYKLNRR